MFDAIQKPHLLFYCISPLTIGMIIQQKICHSTAQRTAVSLYEGTNLLNDTLCCEVMKFYSQIINIISGL